MTEETGPGTAAADSLGPTGHLTPLQLDEVATRASADIDPDRAEVNDGAGLRLQAHLDGCAQCRAALGDQIAVQGWLRRVPGPGPMPSDVVTRLDAAFTRARRDDPPVTATVLPMRTERPAGRLSRFAESRATKSLVAAAAVGLIGIGGYAAISHTSSAGDSGGGSAASSAAGAGAVPQAAKGVDQAAAAVRASGTAYTDANLASQVRLQLAASQTVAKPQTSADAPQAFEAASAARLRTPAGLQACITALGEPAAVPLLVDLATYAGKPAVVIVLPGSSTGREIWVVAPTCTTGADGTITYRLLP